MAAEHGERSVIKQIMGVIGGAGVLVLAAGGAPAVGLASAHPGAGSPGRQAVYVLNQGSGTVVPILTGTRQVLPAIKIGVPPPDTPPARAGSVVAAPDHRVVALDPSTNTVAVISTTTRKVVAKSRLASAISPITLAIAPGATTAYVLGNEGAAGVIVPVRIATAKAGTPVTTDLSPLAMVFGAGGRTGYVLCQGAGEVDGLLVRLDTATNAITGTLRTGVRPAALAIAPDGKTIYVVDSRNAVTGIGNVLPVRTATWTARKRTTVGWTPSAMVIMPDGRTAYVLDAAGAGSHGSSQGAVTPIALATGKAGRAIAVGYFPVALAVTPSGSRVYVLNTENGTRNGGGTVTPVRTASHAAGAAMKTGTGPVAMAVTPDGRTLYVVNQVSGTLTQISTATGKVVHTIRVGARYTSGPVALVIVP